MHWIAPLPAWAAMRHPPPPAPATKEQTLQQHPMAKAWTTRSQLQIARAAVAPIVAEPHALPAACASHRRVQLRGVRSRPLRARHPRDQRAPSATRESDPVRTATAPGSRRSPRVRDTTAPRAERLFPGCDSHNGRQPVPVPIASMWPDSRRSLRLPRAHDREADRTRLRRVPQDARQGWPAVNERSRAARGAHEGHRDDQPDRRLNSHSEKPTIASAGIR